MATYHVWFSTKRRQDALVDEIGVAALNALREAARTSDIATLGSEIAVDHVHLLLVLRDGITLSSAMHRIKGASARSIFLQFPELKFDMQSQSFWQKGYGAREVPVDQIPSVLRYINSQDDRDVRHSELSG